MMLRSITTITIGLFCTFSFPIAAQESTPLPNPLENAQVGEWALYQQPNGSEILHRVTDRSDTTVTVRTQIYVRGKLMDQEIQKVNITHPTMTEEQEYEISKDNLLIKDTYLPCIVFTKDTIQIWVSEKVPVYGQVQVIMNDKPTMQLIDWGIDLPDEQENE